MEVACKSCVCWSINGDMICHTHGCCAGHSICLAASSLWIFSGTLPAQLCTSSCLYALQKPWLQAGTSRLLTSEVSATVADDIVDLQQQGFSVSDALLSPRPSRFGKLLNRYPFRLQPHDSCDNTLISKDRTATLICMPTILKTDLPCFRLVSDAAISSLEAADLDSAALKPRWSTGSHGQHTARQFGLPHSPLLSHNPPVASVFAQDEHQVLTGNMPPHFT